jgi:hypothetical protein
VPLMVPERGDLALCLGCPETAAADFGVGH